MAKDKVKMPEKFTANSIINYVAEKNELSKKQMKEIYESVFEVIEAGIMAGQRVPCGNMGKFFIKVRPATKPRKGRNPLTGEEIMIKAKPATKVPKFTYGKVFKAKALKAKVNK